MFSNKNKTNDKSPDFILYTSNEVGSQASPSFQKDVPKSAVTANVESDDDVPSM